MYDKIKKRGALTITNNFSLATMAGVIFAGNFKSSISSVSVERRTRTH